MGMGVAVKERTRKLTIEEWLSLPEGPPFYELEDGRLIEVPSPRREHQDLMASLYITIRNFAAERGLGTAVMEVDVALPTGVGYIPDIAFISRGREGELLAPDGKVHGAPDLVVEIVSPSTRKRDRVNKFRNYWLANVKWLWLVDSEDLTVEEYRWTEEGYLCVNIADRGETFESKALPGLKFNLSELVAPRRAGKEKGGGGKAPRRRGRKGEKREG